MTTAACPEYRVRLFLSVDLVGSTAFKAGRGSDKAGENDTYPIWVTETRKFYREFPEILASRYQECLGAERVGDCDSHGPKLWKTIGDEIVFCNRLVTVEHLACCVMSFMRAMQDYGKILDESGHKLDVKGTGWVAPFPSPNVTIGVAGRRTTIATEYIDEEIEIEADNSPNNFDFLGKDIDTGFRVTRHSDADKFSLSAELALLLCEASKIGVFKEKFIYRGRDALKGVMNGRPYPVVTIDTERSASRREVLEFERAVTKQGDASSLHLGNFVRSLLLDEGLEVPHLLGSGDRNERSLPSSYVEFRDTWQATVEEVTKRSASEAASSEEGADSADGALPVELSESLDETVPPEAAGGSIN